MTQPRLILTRSILARSMLARLIGRVGLFMVVGVMGGCGWRPLNAPFGSTHEAGLRSIDVAIIPERQGQLLRQALQARLSGGVGEQPALYVLQASYSVQSEGLAITEESSVTRIRLIATSNFVLRPLASASLTCASGVTREVDGYDVQNQQFFAADLAAETAKRRLADATAADIAIKLALAAGRRGDALCEVR